MVTPGGSSTYLSLKYILIPILICNKDYAIECENVYTGASYVRPFTYRDLKYNIAGLANRTT
jgi:hypothetical protein